MNLKSEGRWRTCDTCPQTGVEHEEAVLHADRWDATKRRLPAAAIAYELANAKHKGQWVTIKYQWKTCRFDNKPVIPSGLFHNCPWHEVEPKKEETPWWE